MKIPGYKIDRLIAEGGMASVYLAEQESLGRRVALKVLKNTNNPSFSERFLNEGRIIAALTHQNIITIHDIGVIDDHHYISMEFVEAGDLEAKIASGMTVDEALDLLEKLGNCLDFVHKNGVIHRDIKPANILFRTDGTPLLTDFGIAKQIEANGNLTMDGSALGSPYYFSPEQAQGKTVDGRADIYGLGVIFYEILTGCIPYDGGSPINTIVMHLQEPVPTLPQNLRRYQGFLNRMMAKDANERFRSAAEMVQVVKKIRRSGIAKTNSNATRTSPKLGKSKQPVNKASPRSAFSALPILGMTVLALASLYFVSAATGLKAHFGAGPSGVDSFSIERIFNAIWRPETNHQQHEKSQNIKDLLALASQRYGEEKLTLPKHDSAFFYYSQVIKLDADNISARRGLTDIADRYASMSEQAIKDSDDSKAWKYLERGLAVQPTHDQLLGLKTKIGKVSQKTKDLLTLASQRFEEDKLTLPKHDNALFYYSKVLKIEADNITAHRGITDIAGRYASMGEQAVKDSDYSEARQYLERGLGIQPANEQLLGLKTKIGNVSQKIKSLLTLASQRLREDKLTLPKRDSAFFYYSKVIKLDADNSAAHRGLSNIANRYAGMGEKAFERSDYAKAGQYLERGLGIQPGNKRLLGLKARVATPNQEINELLALASRRFEEYKLTLPKGDSALFYYSKVLKLDARNTAARQGVTDISDRYAGMGEKAVERSEYTKARKYLKQGLRIHPTNKRLLALKTELIRLNSPHQRFLNRVKNLFN